jgi:hypothetical protein
MIINKRGALNLSVILSVALLAYVPAIADQAMQKKSESELEALEDPIGGDAGGARMAHLFP